MFNVNATVENALLVLVVGRSPRPPPFTPGGAGAQQALLVIVLAGSATSSLVLLAYSVGAQIAIAATTFACGFAAIVFIFRFRSFKEVIAAGREHRTGDGATPAPAEPHARA